MRKAPSQDIQRNTMRAQTVVYQAAACLLFVMGYQAMRIPRNPSAEYQISSSCSATGGDCTDITECCSTNDVCLKLPHDPMKPNQPPKNGRNGHCVSIQVDGQTDLLNSGETCTDSHQCKDRCCREISAHRSRHYVCGKPYDVHAHRCVAQALGNNIPGDNL